MAVTSRALDVGEVELAHRYVLLAVVEVYDPDAPIPYVLTGKALELCAKMRADANAETYS